MENLENTTFFMSNDDDCSSINNAIHKNQDSSNSNSWLIEFIKINQCPQREDALENQLNDLSLVAEKLGMYYAAHFIKNLNK